ncbi:ABC transporter substrate-binding protein [Desulfococcaceae bacterium HSG9]|nr:ABC transporter substrate-binding protein [Desulfococcaceae bacterium HSG9]
MKTKYFVLFGLIVATLSIFTWFGCQNMGGGAQMHIALVGPLTNPTGESLVNGVNLYLEKINKDGGINGKTIVLDTFDDQNDSGKASEIALKIAEQKRAVAVIGHNWSSCSISAGEIYKKNGVPAISPISTNAKVTKDNEWYFRTIFDDNLQGRFLANYAKQMLHKNTASIIFEEDRPYGNNLAKIFEESANEIGLTVKYKWGFKSESKDVKENLKTIVDELLLQKEDAGIIFLATHAVDGITIVQLMKDMDISNDIMVPDAFGNKRFSDGFNTYPKEIENPGFYTNGIYVTTPMLYDTANQMAQQFKEQYTQKYQKVPDRYAPFAYDAAMLILEAVKKTEVQGTQSAIKEDRKKIRDYLAGLTKIDDAVKGLTGLNYFNDNGDCRKPISIGVYRSKDIVSALGQLRPVQYMNLIPNVEEAVNKEQIILFDKNYMYKTNVVYTGIEVKSIEDFNIEKSTCVLDFYIWFRFQGDFDADNIEFINALENIELPIPIEDESKEVEVKAQASVEEAPVEEAPAEEAPAVEKAAKEPTAVLIKEDRLKGLTSRLYHVKAKFKADFDKGQEIVQKTFLVGFQFRHRNLGNNNLIYVTDVLGMGLSGEISLAERLKRDNILSDVDGWAIDNAKFFQNTTPKSTMGDLKYLDIQDKFIDSSKFNFNVLLKADTLSMRRKIPVDIAPYMAGGSLALLIFFILIRRRVLSFKITWFFELLCVCCFMLSLEVVILSLALEGVIARRSFGMTLLTFSVLWWIVPAFWTQIGLDPFIWEAMRKQTGRPVPKVLRRFPAYIIYFIAGYGVIAFALDQDITKLMATSGAVAMMVGLIIKDNIANFFASISIIQGYGLKIGNWVKIDGYEEGKITEITKMATSIKTRGGTILTIPNSAIMGSSIHNYDVLDSTYNLSFRFETVDSYAPDHVKQVTKDALLETECVMKNPEPIVFFEGQGDSSAIFTVLFTVNDYAKKGLHKSAAWRSVWMNLEKAGIELATPNRIIHVADKDSDEEDSSAQAPDKQPLPA